jgi:hypothetical protein
MFQYKGLYSNQVQGPISNFYALHSGEDFFSLYMSDLLCSVVTSTVVWK